MKKSLRTKIHQLKPLQGRSFQSIREVLGEPDSVHFRGDDREKSAIWLDRHDAVELQFDRSDVCTSVSSEIKTNSFRKFLIPVVLLCVFVVLMGVSFRLFDKQKFETIAGLADYRQSEAARKVDKQIAAIGEVTLDSGDAITAAEKAQKDLNASDRNELKRADDLKKARDKYNALKEAHSIDSLIEGIGKVTDLDGKIIKVARNRYDSASDDAKRLVTKLDVLEEAEAEYKKIEETDEAQKEQDALPKIQEAINRINAIGEVTENSKPLIDAAENAYNSVPGEFRSQVTNADILRQAKNTYDNAVSYALKSNALDKLKSMRTTVDQVEQCTFYFPDSMPRYINDHSYVLPYIGEHFNQQDYWLMLQYDYTGDDWIFWDHVIFSIDGVNYTKNMDYFDIERDNGDGERETYQTEYVDVSLLQKIADSNTTIIRFEGDYKISDFTVSEADKQSIRDVLLVYDAFIK